MKLLLLLVSILALCGCASVEQQIDKSIPDGKAKKVTATVTGKFSSTQFTAEDFVKTPEKVTASKLHLRHSDVYVPLIEVEYEDYERERKH